MVVTRALAPWLHTLLLVQENSARFTHFAGYVWNLHTCMSMSFYGIYCQFNKVRGPK